MSELTHDKDATKEWSRMTLVLLIATAGALGSLARWKFADAVQGRAGGAFPWGTFAVNMLGAFAFGAIYAASAERNMISPGARTVLLTGFMGAFTTFSTLAFDTSELLRTGHWLAAAGNYLGSGVVGIVGVGLGMMVGRTLGA